MRTGAESESARTRIVRAAQVDLQVTERGRGMPVLLVHGFLLDHTMWDAQIEQLSGRWRVIAPDLRGSGGSQVSGPIVSIEQMADDLNALLDALGIAEPIVFCGLSMGGYVAFQFWRKYARRLRGLVLCDTRAVADTPEAAALRLKTAAEVLRDGMSGAAEAMLPRVVAPATFEQHPEVVASLRRTFLAAPPVGVAAALHGLAERPDVSSDLARLALPTLVIVGEHDAISTADEMRGMARAIPGSEFVVVPDAGHLSPMENPAAFNQALEQFLTRVERAV